MITESDRISYHESAPKVYKKIKLYAEESIRYGIVLALRLQGINIKHVSEVNLAGKDDSSFSIC